MKRTFTMIAIGSVEQGRSCTINVEPAYRAALAGLGEFSHVLVFWVFDKAPWDGKTLTTPPCYKRLDHELGVFATRGPFRPNPIAMTISRILSLDVGKGILEVDWIDAEAGSPVVDLKPYHPSSDVVTDYAMPKWCAHWPKSRDASGEFDWDSEFTF